MSSTSTRAWATGGLVFAASMMIMIGMWQTLVGIAAIAADEFFVTTPNYAYDIDTTQWGWVHLAFGVLAVVTGIVLFSGAAWARAVAIVLAGLSAINNFLFMPYYPLWAIAVIAINVFIIWSLVTVGSPVRGGAAPGAGTDSFATSPEAAANAARADVASAHAQSQQSRLINR